MALEASGGGASAPRRRTVLITGASRGLGRAMAVELARRGHTIIGVARSEEKLASLREECPRPEGQPHLFTALDVTSDPGVKELAQRVLAEGLVPDIVVNNAGIAHSLKKIWELPTEEVGMVMNININGTINILRHFLPILINRGNGIVVNMSSILGRTAAPNLAPYCTTKWAIEGLSRVVSLEVPHGVIVVSLDPGVIQTDMLVAGCGEKAMSFPKPEAWAPTAVDMILNFTIEDNGTSPVVAMDRKTSLKAAELFPNSVEALNI